MLAVEHAQAVSWERNPSFFFFLFFPKGSSQMILQNRPAASPADFGAESGYLLTTSSTWGLLWGHPRMWYFWSLVKPFLFECSSSGKSRGPRRMDFQPMRCVLAGYVGRELHRVGSASLWGKRWSVSERLAHLRSFWLKESPSQCFKRPHFSLPACCHG